MADKELGALSPIEALLAAALFHTVQEGNSRKVTAQQIVDFVNGNYPAFIQTLLSAQSAEDVYDAIGVAPDAAKLGGQLPSFFASAEAIDLELQNVNDALADKVPNSRTVAGKPLSDNITLTKADVGLGNADNTADANKPVSVAQQTAIDVKVTGPNGGVASGDIMAFGDPTGKLGRKATQTELKAAIGGVPIAGYISPGFNLANNASDPTNDIDFPAGIVGSSNAVPILMVHTAVTMQLDIAWGTGNGGRFDSAISDGTWHCFIIGNGTLVSRGLSKSVDPTSQPNYPSGFAHYRRVGSVIRSGNAIRPFVQREDHFDYTSPILDRSSSAAFASSLLAISTPAGIVTEAKLKLIQQQNATGVTHTRVGSAGGPLHSAMVTVIAQEVESAVIPGGIFTDLSSRIQFNVDIISGSIFLSDITTVGWIDKRGKA
ncbi:hypothetical protein [Agrobacterium tumefaciens]|uniref:hypothetical protein n=1 Tax=Agrobacterium tumefaciens TaxID=358 RepID=UPI001659C193|nr:hypothetical protein [Agrobacterium tumefaciens]QNP81171.1 hypothetical protein IAI05_07560 [Agrobacterium tumefaciens]